MIRFIAALGLLSTVACAPAEAPPGGKKPTGTPTDPVAVCERVADVCRLDGARLGVCTPASSPAACQGVEPCFVCMSQH